VILACSIVLNVHQLRKWRMHSTNFVSITWNFCYSRFQGKSAKGRYFQTDNCEWDFIQKCNGNGFRAVKLCHLSGVTKFINAIRFLVMARRPVRRTGCDTPDDSQVHFMSDLFRGADCGTDSCLMVAKRTEISTVSKGAARKFDLQRFDLR
jgi:hypothetical protein